MGVSRTRRRLVVAASPLAVVLAALAGWWVSDHDPLSAVEQNLVGAWAQTRDDGVPEGVLVEFVVTENRTAKFIKRDAETGAVTLEEYDSWRIAGGVLGLSRRPQKPPAITWLAWWDRSNRVGFHNPLRLAPDGPDRIRFTILHHTATMGTPLPTGTWTRVGAK